MTYAADTSLKAEGVVSEDISPNPDEACIGPSGRATTLCAVITEEKNAKVRKRRFQKIVRAFGSADKLEAIHLQVATERFAYNRGRLESDATGSARGAIAIEARVEELSLLLNDLENFEGGKFPELHTSMDLAAADQELNQVYAEILGMRPDEANGFGLSEITLDGIRTTERSWIAYRNEWVHFARLRYRKLDPVSLQYLLTKRRLAELQDVLEIIRVDS